MALNDEDLKARMNKFVPPTAAILGQEILEIDSAAGVVKMKFQPIDACRNPMGNVQGGIVVSMLDDAAAFAAIVKSGKRIGIPTIELKTSFFAPAKAGVPLYATGRCLKLGKRIAFMEADLFDEAGTLLARLTTSAVPLELDGPSNLVERT
ncbi:cytosolic protein [Sandarakinorhabdus cyanobacteriorum]|uniref:Cytosolic protein n=1 Tax=Sandarakinorhabdus cyanobacteriorum TaxID=1981098 RepID=A0A255Y675_9SPHN|nr:PaaI family thioesterase [Sandarakinorhabdus cyanobacteriorum]OYQ24729.1 cytosolic protein [Sandarakinorhabdus cyanobacteriorum]